MKITNYNECLNWLYSFPTHRLQSHNIDSTKNMLAYLGNPQDNAKIIHVAGTNGKGSTSAYIHSIMQKAGYKCGFYTSPYLQKFNERVQIDEPIEDEMLIKGFNLIIEAIEKTNAKPSQFEIITTLGYWYFDQKDVDYSVIEVGLGGRFDPTNIAQPIISVIAAIGFDHTEYLGNTLTSIAYEKAGIIKPNVPVVSYPQEQEAEDVLVSTAKELNAPYYNIKDAEVSIKDLSLEGCLFDIKYDDIEFEDVKVRLNGRHQCFNASAALITAKVLQKNGLHITDQNIIEGLRDTVWPGRMELIRRDDKPDYILDGAHNVHGARALCSQIKELVKAEPKVFVCSIKGTKDAQNMIKEFADCADKVIIHQYSKEHYKPDYLIDLFKKYGKDAVMIEKTEDAMEYAEELAGDTGTVIICGSLYIVGEVRNIIYGLKTEYH